MIAERESGEETLPEVVDASMRPRSDDRGKSMNAAIMRTDAICFNEAAI